ncbi:MAG: hypothetical protein H7Y31_17635 [Chitinophagaceae bacterium]|nr:hypothetical protein [Chitinophagaceae bacterium]
MTTNLLRSLTIMLTLAACSSSRNNNYTSQTQPANAEAFAQPKIGSDRSPQSLMDLPQTEFGGFVLKPGFYEAEFKTYCLQPGTPDPRQGDAYLQQPITGYRKDIVESVLLNSKERNDIDQKNIQLLLWSTVSGSDFNRLPRSVQLDASKLLTSKQLFELKGGVVGVIRTISSTTGILNANSDIKKLFETSINSYEAFEKIAVRREQSQVIKKGVKADQWYKQKENYYVRYFPESYKKVKIQVYVPDGLLDTDNKANNEYVVFDPTGQQAIPAFTNAQRLGIGAPVIIDIVRTVIKINKPSPPKKTTDKPKNSKSA